ncbi:1,4-alpha-glucan branching enzyme [Catenibacillus scindens]|uniref:1,4-alpha-glucan branching enzyme GlgB n=1 Tax=Catenibacillus scindens TaxID=673271 RepID=A0A7W8H8H6_9FIRM|nr:1,4-alpha-glucan branching protein GlgB [Catenibacillus scindens]MBB5263610.1 1,4-alpha-glucan branching enzyme [Catenibacillus scindens]
MEEKLYSKMQWPEIEALVYSEHDRPRQILGQQVTEDGILITAFNPDAIDITVKNTKNHREYPMEKADEGGYFAVLVDGDKPFPYVYIVNYGEDNIVEQGDPYAFDSIITEEDLKKFEAGIHYQLYNILGAHVTTIQGVSGVHFAVWAPEAIRVSVVGDFCNWDGRRYPMQRLSDSGVHELFIPGLTEGTLYKYEVKIKGDTVVLKSDPYGYFTEVRPDTASIVYDINKYTWNDSAWMKQRDKTDTRSQPMLIYELHLGGFKKPDEEDGRYFYNYRELAPMIASYVKEMGYTHIEVMPVMEHPLDESWGYQVTGYYAPTSRYGTPDDFMYFMDYMHQQGIGVILDWVPAHFPRDLAGLARFDGSCVYEHPDPRRGSHPHWGTLIFNYGRPQVSNFLIANALYWVEKYHADGIRMDAVASMLYLDYGKQDGEWLPNIYGSNENLEAIELLKHLNSVMKKRNPGAIMIAEESTAWPKITYPVEDDGLGFDYKWNMGWMNDFTGFMKLDPLFRKYHYGELLFSMVYAYSENFILVLSHDEVVHGKCSMIGKMPGEGSEKFDNLRVAYGFMTAHPGKKLLFMGQEYAQFTEFNEAKSLEWFMLKYPQHKQMQEYVRDLNHLYTSHPAFYKLDTDPDGFEWINCISADETIVVFLRKTEKEDETLLFVCNFTPVVYEDHKIGVPFPGKYKEIFNSDAVIYGGQGHTNPRLKQSKKDECDDREDSIRITVAPMAMAVFSCTHLEPAKKPAKAQAKGSVKKTASKKAPGKKTASSASSKKSVKASVTPAKKDTGAKSAAKNADTKNAGTKNTRVKDTNTKNTDTKGKAKS